MRGRERSQLQVADVGFVESTGELLDGFLDFSAEMLIGAGDHLIIGHHIVVQSLLDDVLRHHATYLSCFIKERQVTLIVDVEVDGDA